MATCTQSCRPQGMALVWVFPFTCLRSPSFRGSHCLFSCFLTSAWTELTAAGDSSSSLAGVIPQLLQKAQRRPAQTGPHPRPWPLLPPARPGRPRPPAATGRTGAWPEEHLHRLQLTVSSLNRVPLCATPWTAARQAPPSMRFPRQEYWSGLPFPSLSRGSSRPRD